MEEVVFESYVEFSNKLRMGEAFDDNKLTEILKLVEKITDTLECVPKKISYILINIPIDLDIAITHSSYKDRDVIQASLANYLDFIDRILNKPAQED